MTPPAFPAEDPGGVCDIGGGTKSGGRGSATYREYRAESVLAADEGRGGFVRCPLAAVAAARWEALADSAPRAAADAGWC